MLNRYLPGILSLFPEKKFKQVTVVVTSTYIPHEGDVWLLEENSVEWCIEDSSTEWKLSSCDTNNSWKIEIKRVC